MLLKQKKSNINVGGYAYTVALYGDTSTYVVFETGYRWQPDVGLQSCKYCFCFVSTAQVLNGILVGKGTDPLNLTQTKADLRCIFNLEIDLNY